MRPSFGRSLLGLLLAVALGAAALAYNPRPGSWTGWLVCDPWGSMYFYNHCYIYPVSQDIVPRLKEHAGKPCRVTVTKTYEVATPGPVRIVEAAYDRPVPLGELEALSFTASLGAPTREGKAPTLTLKVRNRTQEKARFIAAQLTVMVLVRGSPPSWTLANGHSYPHERYGGRLWIGAFDIVQQTGPARVINSTWYHALGPGEEYTCTVELRLSAGEYYVWGGYGEAGFWGPASLMSNGVHFHVPDVAGADGK